MQSNRKSVTSANMVVFKNPITEVIDPENMNTSQIELVLSLYRDFQEQKGQTSKAAAYKACGRILKKYYQTTIPCRYKYGMEMLQTIAFTQDFIILPLMHLNPTKLNDTNKRVLKFLIHQYAMKPILSVEHPVTNIPNILMVAVPKSGRYGRVAIQPVSLTHTLVRFPSKKSATEYRYAVCNKKPFADGGLGVTYLSHRTLKSMGESEGRRQIDCKTKDNPAKWRIVKLMHLPTDNKGNLRRIGETCQVDRRLQNIITKSEVYFLQKLSFFHVKESILSENDDSPAIIMRCAEGEELHNYMYDDIHNIKVFSVDQRIDLTILVIEAILLVHQMHIIHRDIKPENIMVKVDENYNPVSAVIIDFGLAVHENDKDHLFSGGTVDYLSPEVKAGELAGQSSDTYAFVLIMRTMLWANMHSHKYHGLSPEHKVCILAAMINGLEEYRNGRATLDEILAVFKRIKQQRPEEIEKLTPCLK